MLCGSLLLSERHVATQALAIRPVVDYHRAGVLCGERHVAARALEQRL
jgi:hypothetical protein